MSFCHVHAKVHTCHFVMYMPRYIPVILSCTCPLLKLAERGTYVSFCRVHAKVHTCHFVMYMPIVYVFQITMLRQSLPRNCKTVSVARYVEIKSLQMYIFMLL